MKKKFTNIYFVLGVLLFASALILSLYNVFDDRRAGKIASEALNDIKSNQKTSEDLYWSDDPDEYEVPDYQLNPNVPMTTNIVNGMSYVGVISISSIGVELPVIEKWSYPNLKVGPCVYSGSPYLNNFIVMAHNYLSHFAKLNNLNYNDIVNFSDIDGNKFVYQVVEKEILKENQIEDLLAGEWDLTLFTCTLNMNVSSRAVIRCVKVDEIPNTSKQENILDE